VTRLACALALAASLTTGCVIHFGDDDEPVPCDVAAGDGTTAAADIAISLLLDPETLACVEVGFGGCGVCGPCPEPAIPTWAACQTSCTGLAENDCIRTEGCRTAYDHACLTGEGACPALVPYLGCFAVDTTGPVRGACDGLDAFECSRHDDCLATYRDSGGCANGIDDDRDGQVDESDECRRFAACMGELAPF
jgi:hypothetical protein